ncbi:50S ribosomal protein L1 [Candidatus Woesearchaeota archaeon]|nr:50S ribosomal protein L1 [Candidatus Woesearchaeota archaeon]
MEKTEILEAIKACKENTKKRNFQQSFDLIINLKGIDLKKTDNQKEFFIILPHVTKTKKICALIGGELKEQATEICDKFLISDDFAEYSKDKKAVKKLTDEYDYFIAQANIMPQIATSFGKVFGPRGKMPNPKAGCIVPPKVQLNPIYDKLQKTVKAAWKKSLVLQVLVGTETMKDEEIADNIITYYNTVIGQLPNDINNLKSVYLKLTMGSIVKIKV